MTSNLTNAKPIQVYCDGACKPNPGTGYIGVYCADPCFEIARRIEGHSTNNRAECLAAIVALEECKRLGLDGVHLLTDSQLVVGWTTGTLRWKSITAHDYVPSIRRLLREVKATIKWIPGKLNRADKLSKSLILTPADRRLTAVKSGKDEFSKMRKPALIEAVGGEAWSRITITLDEEKYQLSAARWLLRGMPLEKAIRRVQAQREIGHHMNEYRRNKDE